MGPTLAPVGNSGSHPHHFSGDTKPEHVPGGASGSEAGAKPGAQDRDDHEEPRAREESGIGGDATFDEIAREEARKQRVCGEDKNHRQQVAAQDDGDGLNH
jgi:hypothetical protein